MYIHIMRAQEYTSFAFDTYCYIAPQSLESIFIFIKLATVAFSSKRHWEC